MLAHKSNFNRNLVRCSCTERTIYYNMYIVYVSCHCISCLSCEGSSWDFARSGRVPSFPSPTSDIFPAAVLADRMERRFLGVGARNEFNSTALRNWLRSHSSGKFLIVCPAPSEEFARSRRGVVTALYQRPDHQYLCPQDTTGVSRVFRVVSRTRVPLAR